jgi:hypothetical protein
MSSDDVTDLADRVKKFFYRRAFLAERMCDENNAGCRSRLTIAGEPELLPPDIYEPLDNLYYESRIVALVAIEALATHWEWIEVIPTRHSYGGRYRARFSDFLKQLGFDDRLPRVCTPLLVYTLEQLGLEDHFRRIVFEKWVNQRDEGTNHPVGADPSIDDLNDLHDQCMRDTPQPPTKRIKRHDGHIRGVLEKFQYSALIYKYFRNSLVHEYRPSRYTGSFARGIEILVPTLSGYLVPVQSSDGQITTRVEDIIGGPIPQLDIGLGLLTQAVRVGADFVHGLMMAHHITDIPYSASLIPIAPEAKA